MKPTDLEKHLDRMEHNGKTAKSERWIKMIFFLILILYAHLQERYTNFSKYIHNRMKQWDLNEATVCVWLFHGTPEIKEFSRS